MGQGAMPPKKQLMTNSVKYVLPDGFHWHSIHILQKFNFGRGLQCSPDLVGWKGEYSSPFTTRHLALDSFVVEARCRSHRETDTEVAP